MAQLLPRPEQQPSRAAPDTELEVQLDDHVAAAWSLFHERLSSPRYWLAPMVGQSEPAFRMLVRSLGADICSTEMIDVGGYAKSADYRAQFPFFQADRPLVVQLGGSDRASLAPAARLVEEARGCDAIEINAGCPQACARKGRYGAFLMDEPDALCAMVRELRQAVSLPILVKIRVFPVRKTPVTDKNDGFAKTCSGQT
jgi:tRNA-dihydrouridine synthase 1